MGLCPGLYQGKLSRDEAINIAEGAFSFLEPGIKRHCPSYALRYAHWGVTEISRQEWIAIFDEWERLKVNLEAARLTPHLGILRFVVKDVRSEFVKDFDRNRVRLSRIIGRLTDWMRAELLVHEHISVLGI
jgi:hypothetical protein